MLERIDRVQIAVADRKAASETFARLLGAEVAREDHSSYLGAQRTVLAVGESEIELCEPDGTGRVAQRLAKRGEGLLTAGASTNEPEALKARLAGLGVEVESEGDQMYLAGDPGFGVPFVISPTQPRPRVGPVSFLYEVTNTLVSDWRLAAAWYAGLFGLDSARFSNIESGRFGYQGTLTLFGPPDRLDRIELSQVVGPGSAMARWVAKRGDSLYMCYIETHDTAEVVSRLNEAGAAWTPRGDTQEGEMDGLWIHPASLHGLLLGVSRTTLAWEWSGRPELIVEQRSE